VDAGNLSSADAGAAEGQHCMSWARELQPSSQYNSWSPESAEGDARARPPKVHALPDVIHDDPDGTGSCIATMNQAPNLGKGGTLVYPTRSVISEPSFPRAWS